MKGKSLGLRARGPGADPRTERRMRASSQGPSRQNFLEKGGCVFSSWALRRGASACPLVGVLRRLGRVRPVSVPFVVLSFVAVLVAFGVRFSLWAPSRRPALFWRYLLCYALQPTPYGIECQDAAASSGTSDRSSCRNLGTCIITVMLLLSMSVPQLCPVLYFVKGAPVFWDFGSSCL